MTASRLKQPRPGACRVCGCVNERACPEGCCWVSERGVAMRRLDRNAEVLCSACSGTEADLAYSVKWARGLVAVSRGDAWKVLNDALARFRRRQTAAGAFR